MRKKGLAKGVCLDPRLYFIKEGGLTGRTGGNTERENKSLGRKKKVFIRV